MSRKTEIAAVFFPRDTMWMVKRGRRGWWVTVSMPEATVSGIVTDRMQDVPVDSDEGQMVLAAIREASRAGEAE